MSERIEKWDILKFGLIFSVVLGHIADFYTGESEIMRSLFLFIYSFHMPLFIFVSGLFAKNTVNQKRVGKWFVFLILYVLIKTIFMIYYFLSGASALRINVASENGVPWFMLAMFAFPLITYNLRNVKAKYVLLISVVFALIVGYDPSIKDTFVLSRIIVYFPFYYLGYITNADKLQELTDKRSVKIISLIFLALFCFTVFYLGDKVYFIRAIFTGRNPYVTLGDKANYGALLRLISYVVSTLVGFSLIAITPKRTPIKFISRFGTRTLAVYAFHYIIIYVLYDKLQIKTIFENLFTNGGSGYAIIPLALIITVVLSLKIFSLPIDAVLSLPQKAKKS